MVRGMRARRAIVIHCILSAAACTSSAPRAARAAGQPPAAPVAHFVEIETDAGSAVGMTPTAEGAAVAWRADDGRGEVAEQAGLDPAGETWQGVFRVVAMPAGREAFLHLPLRTPDGHPVEILVHGAPLEPGFGAMEARVLLGRDEATRIAVRRRAR